MGKIYLWFLPIWGYLIESNGMINRLDSDSLFQETGRNDTLQETKRNKVYTHTHDLSYMYLIYMCVYVISIQMALCGIKLISLF